MPPQALFHIEHLRNQTSGDRGLEREVLMIFLAQLDGIDRRSLSFASAARGEMLHKLKGAARGVGAFALADAAQLAEQTSPAPDLTEAFLDCMAATREAVEARLADNASQS